MIWSISKTLAALRTPAFKREFPFARPQDLEETHGEKIKMTRYLAQSHELTEPEVREQLELLAMREHLARGALGA